MKETTEIILESLPVLRKFIPSENNLILEQRFLDQLNPTEQVFLELIWFIEKPDESNFNLFDVYKNLDGDWLSFALECIVNFFIKDTFLLKEPNFSIITEDSRYLNQTDFANYLLSFKEEHGLNFSRAMINTYLKRGLIPPADVVISDVKYWDMNTCRNYLNDLINKKKQNLQFQK